MLGKKSLKKPTKQRQKNESISQGVGKEKKFLFKTGTFSEYYIATMLRYYDTLARNKGKC